MDDAAFDAFYDRTAADVARHVYLLTASPHRAVHVTHRAYARAYAEWATVAQLPSPETWVRMLAADMALDHLHRAQHKVTGWIPHADRIARVVRRDAPSEASSRKSGEESAAKPSEEPTEERADEPPEQPVEQPATPKKAGDNRSKKKGRKPRQDRSAPTARPPARANGDASAAPVPKLTAPQPPPKPGAADPPVPDLTDDKSNTIDRNWSADVALLRALRRVPAHRRRAAVLHHQLGFAPEEIAVETEATTGSTIERIALANQQLARRVGELTGPDPDGPEAHERLSAVLGDLTRRYEPQLRPAHSVRGGARARTGVLVAVVVVAALVLAGYAIASMADPGGLPDKRAEAQASIAAREAAGISLTPKLPKPAFKIGRTNAKAQQIPEGERELVYVKGIVNQDGGIFLTVDSARVDAPSGPGAMTREVPLSPDVRIRGEAAFGLTEEKSVDPEEFLDRVLSGSLAKAAFELTYNDELQVERITEYHR